MSGWGFLSKAEGFLDRVLEEQSKDKGEQKKLPSNSTGAKTGFEPLARVSTPTSRWQDRLSKAASQFTSTDSLPSIIQSRPSLDIETTGQSSTTTSNVGQETAAVSGLAQAGNADSTANVLQHSEPLTELQKSKTYPPNMPSYLEKQSDVVTEPEAEPDTAVAATLAIPNAEPSKGRSSSQSVRSVDSTTKLSSAKVSSESQRSAAPVVPAVVLPDMSSMAHSDLVALVSSLSQDLQSCESRRLDEFQVNAERISALERRLAYFSDESLSKNRNMTATPGATTHEKLLAEKDARIALLLEEGDNLSKRELLHLANLKKLRTRTTELETLIATSLKAVQKADADNSANKKEIKIVQEQLGRSEAKVKELTRFENEVGDLRTEKRTQTRVISDLKRQLSDADDTISQNVKIWTQLQSEKTKTENLQKQIGNLLAEAKVTADENASEMAELQGRFDRLNERSQATEAEKAADVVRLETELENLRATLEESTTNASENAQAKLLRQIEGLQTSQSLARQNWARIEESLVMRSKHAEQERDELREQEDEFRNRLRSAVLQRKEVEEERSVAQAQAKAHQNTIRDLRDQIESLVRQVEEARATLEAERQSWMVERETLSTSLENRVQERVMEERQASQMSAPQSPFLQDRPGRAGYAFQRHVPDSPNTSRTPDKRPSLGSRPPTQNSRMPTFRRKTSQYSVVEDLRSPITTYQQDDEVSNMDDGTGFLRAHTEVASISSASAGASVGMMERVSSTVRKLELEMGIMREDLMRVTRQRDEARSACVGVEALEAERDELKNTLGQLEQSRVKLEEKFEATLELLGEQTEENEQLKEDIVDMRKAFRETLEGVNLT
ncbi:Putative uncharacterized protein [Taphrina deformans PYCC 5710]|uniref:TATA element modulatory factor 1 TATA binding domain-containing protein n=1 Tax=Taphrina deformans (strain PYCC 5710 / ATCC 11124 / CBS 356.35 / IMI 108563 / JCM 9778 / NBRC 8474) TaxID=1097556 RepID=R4X995_TAPDE|nr:Putative uncharacterized protein [Taphrina deformans PYCC 5710]|eukprot:CCG82255.1 Putative uncharacterized protein [Taphrina deformans PYCC 5710]